MFTDVLQVFFPHDPDNRLVIDGEVFFSELVVYLAVAVAAPVFRMYGLDPGVFVYVAGQSARLQEML